MLYSPNVCLLFYKHTPEQLHTRMKKVSKAPKLVTANQVLQGCVYTVDNWEIMLSTGFASEMALAVCVFKQKNHHVS